MQYSYAFLDFILIWNLLFLILFFGADEVIYKNILESTADVEKNPLELQ